MFVHSIEVESDEHGIRVRNAVVSSCGVARLVKFHEFWGQGYICFARDIEKSNPDVCRAILKAWLRVELGRLREARMSGSVSPQWLANMYFSSRLGTRIWVRKLQQLKSAA